MNELIEEIESVLHDIKRHCDPDAFCVDLKSLDAEQLRKILTRLQVVGDIMLSAFTNLD